MATTTGKSPMPSTRSQPMYRQIARRIEGQIEDGAFNVGDRIYSIREICEQFDVADVTAKRAFGELRSRGIIRTVAGSGAFVADPDDGREEKKAARYQTVAFVKIGTAPAPVFVHEIDLLQQELSRLGHPMVYSVAASGDDVSRVVEQAMAIGAGCLIVFPPHSEPFESASYQSVLRKVTIPTLIAETRTTRGSYVTSDTERATYDLADYLYDIGHRRICLATDFARKIAGFEHALERWNDPTVKHWIIGETGKSDDASRDLARRIAALRPRPTAVIASDDHAAAVLISHFESTGLRVPDDISVVTFGDHPQLSGLSPVPVTVMRHPFVENAQEIAAWAHRHLTHAAPVKPIRREITGTLIIRESSGPPPA